METPSASPHPFEMSSSAIRDALALLDEVAAVRGGRLAPVLLERKAALLAELALRERLAAKRPGSLAEAVENRRAEEASAGTLKWNGRTASGKCWVCGLQDCTLTERDEGTDDAVAAHVAGLDREEAETAARVEAEREEAGR